MSAATATGVIDLRGVGHVYNDRTPWARRALTGIDLVVGAGERVAVVGGNGSGKSTLAWIIGGLITPSEGEARIAGRAPRPGSGIAAVAFQHARLQLLEPTVQADVMAAAGVGAAEAAGALAAVGLDPVFVARRSVDQLSAGQQRRVALAGVLARRPAVVVLDEPLAGLDREGVEALGAAIDALDDGTRVIVIVTHDLQSVDRLARRRITLRTGSIAADDPIGTV